MSYIHRAPISKWKREAVERNAEYTQNDGNGNIVSPNGTGKVMDENVKTDIGHRNGFENRYEVEFSEKAGLTQREHNKMFTNPGTLQLEPSDENRSHKFENKDHNDAMQNVSSYAYSQSSDIAANTYINPSEDGKSGNISVVNAQTGEENTLCSYELPGNSDIEGADLSSGNNLDDCCTNSNESEVYSSYDDANADDDEDASTI